MPLDKTSAIPKTQQERISLAVEVLSVALRPGGKVGFFYQCVIDAVESKNNGRVRWLQEQNGRFGTGLKLIVEKEQAIFQQVLAECIEQPKVPSIAVPVALELTQQSSAPGYDEIKPQVLQILGVEDTKSIKIWMKQQGLKISLATNEGWRQLLAVVQQSTMQEAA